MILAGVGQITPQQADQIQRFVEQGGTLMLFMGEAVNARELQRRCCCRAGCCPVRWPSESSAAGRATEGVLLRLQAGRRAASAAEHLPRRGKLGSGYRARFSLIGKSNLPADSKVQRVLDYLPDEKGHQRSGDHRSRPRARPRRVLLDDAPTPTGPACPAKPAYRLAHARAAQPAR